jgi:hypothetical protein
MAIAVAEAKSRSDKDITLLFLKNLRLRSRRGLVRREPVTWVYSHDLIAKKKAPMARSAVAASASEEVGSWACL